MLCSHTDPQYVPFLKPSQDEDSYINASFIDVRKSHHVSLYVLGAVFLTQGYKYHRAYIATQAPMHNTVSDIWKMMWEFKSKVMVMLCNLTEDGHEACHQFWPTNEGNTAKYGKITVTLQRESSLGDFVTRKLLMKEEQVYN